jgi:hypothetical protein
LFIWSYALIGLVGGNSLDCSHDANRNSVMEKMGSPRCLRMARKPNPIRSIATSFFYHIRKDENKTTIHFKGIFFLHFINGGLAGIAFPYIIYFVLAPLGAPDIARVYLLGILYGSILWLLTLALIHKPLTGLSPWNHPLGHSPALVSFGGHLVYGIVLAAIVSILTAQFSMSKFGKGIKIPGFNWPLFDIIYTTKRPPNVGDSVIGGLRFHLSGNQNQ